MVTTLEKPRTELAAAKRASIYDDEKVAAAQALVERMRQAVVDAEAEFAAATERGVVNEIDALLTGENPSSGADEALRKLNIAREALALATKSLDVAAIHASGRLIEAEKPRHAKIGMMIFQNLLDLQSTLDTETAFINELRDRGVISTIPLLSLGGEANDILRRLARLDLGHFAKVLRARFDV